MAVDAKKQEMMDTAYLGGVDDRLSGKSLGANPFAGMEDAWGKDASEEWIKGWTEQDELMLLRDISAKTFTFLKGRYDGEDIPSLVNWWASEYGGLT